MNTKWVKYKNGKGEYNSGKGQFTHRRNATIGRIYYKSKEDFDNKVNGEIKL